MTDAKNVAWILVIEDEWNFARKQRTQRFWKLRSVGFFEGGSYIRKALGYAPCMESCTSLGLRSAM